MEPIELAPVWVGSDVALKVDIVALFDVVWIQSAA
jgi:hypothetical protein